MTRHTRMTTAVVTGSALLLLAGNAMAAKPMTDAQKKAQAAAVAAKSRNLPQPRTMAEADATQTRLPNGGVMVLVPTELWNHLSVTRDPDGALRLVESEGEAVPARARKEAEHE